MREENGEMIIEASIIMPLVLIVYGVMLFLALLMYQKIVVTVSANESANAVAAVYSSPYKDPEIGYVGPQELSERDFLYREIFTLSSLQTGSQRKAEWYTYYLLSKRRLLKADDVKVSAEIKRESGTIMQKNVCITVTEKYKIPLVGILGIDNEVAFTSTSAAQCQDFISYINMTDFAWEQIDYYNILNDSKIVSVIKKTIELIKN